MKPQPALRQRKHGMDWDFLTDWDARRNGRAYETVESLIDDLIDNGATPELENEILEGLDKHGDAIDVGYSPQGIYWAFRKEYDARLHRQAEQEKNDRAREQLDRARSIADDVERNPDARDLQKPVADLTKIADTLREIYEPPKAPLSSENLFDFGATHELPIDFLGGLALPSPGITVIGGKAASGKTTALINVVRSLLENGRRVAVFSYEQTKQDIALLLALSLMAQTRTQTVDSPPSYGPPERFTAPQDDHIAPAGEILSDYPTALKRYIQAHGVPGFLQEAYARITEAMETGALEIWDYFGHAEELSAGIERSDFDAYVVDYIQVIPPAPGQAREGYQRIADIATQFRRLASANGKTLIVGAQVNRQSGDSQDPNEYDPAMEQFREAADIEHLATLALGLGWYKDEDGKKARYWKILKHRYNGAAQNARMFSGGVFAYCYIQPYSEWAKPADWPIEGAPTKKTAKKAGDKRGAGSKVAREWGSI